MWFEPLQHTWISLWKSYMNFTYFIKHFLSNGWMQQHAEGELTIPCWNKWISEALSSSFSWVLVTDWQYDFSKSHAPLLTCLVGINSASCLWVRWNNRLLPEQVTSLPLIHFFLPVPVSAGRACCTSWLFLRWFSDLEMSNAVWKLIPDQIGRAPDTAACDGPSMVL